MSQDSKLDLLERSAINEALILLGNFDLGPKSEDEKRVLELALATAFNRGALAAGQLFGAVL